MKNIHWYLVASRIEARIFAQEGVNCKLELIERLKNPEGRLKNQDLVSDRPGQADPTRNSYQPPTLPTEQILISFSRSISDYLEQARQNNAFKTITLVAPPNVLGAIKQELSNPISTLVRATLSSDLANVKSREMSSRLKGVLVEREPIAFHG